MSHSGAKLLAVNDIIAAAKGANPESDVKICMIYVIPQAHASKFRPPLCNGLVAVGVTVCVGSITNEDDLIAKYLSELS